MMTVKRKFSPLLPAALALYAIFACAGMVSAMLEEVILEVTGILNGIDMAQEPPVLTLTVKTDEGTEETASSPLYPECFFLDERGDRISREYFVERYTGKTVKLELYERTGEMMTCQSVN